MVDLRWNWPRRWRRSSHQYARSCQPKLHMDPRMQIPMAIRHRNFCSSSHHHDRRASTRKGKVHLGMREREAAMACVGGLGLRRNDEYAIRALHRRVPEPLHHLHRRATGGPCIPDVHVLHDMAVPETFGALHEHEALDRRLLQRLNNRTPTSGSGTFHLPIEHCFAFGLSLRCPHFPALFWARHDHATTYDPLMTDLLR